MRPLVLCLALALAGCPDRSISPVAPDQASVFTKDLPVAASLDLLFVIDDSQRDCTVSEIQDVDTAAQTEQVIPRCRMLAEDQPDLAGAPAWWWVQRDATCTTETQLALRVEGAAPPRGSVVRVACTGAAEPAAP
ncbi:MAG: hypothetical protein E6J90_49820 [Deltaproteobacteria bacterium]|nr:MAG: hypothetical protein E6J90_49820 [Deltaproteobacteria bacterium]TMQ20687.1 MAG: hypothetical protein E6J91_03450 [Deltaproteobacteria bacterium]